MKKKIPVYEEIIYAVGLLLLSFAVAMVAAADFGVSMIVAPAYVLSLKVDVLSFGQSEYIVQAVLFIVFCILMKRVRLIYFTSFGTCLIYGALLDFWRAVIPAFNPAVTAPGSMAMPVRIVFFVGGMLLTSFSVALFYHTYFYPQVYDFFVKGLSIRYKKDTVKFKMIFDACCLVVAVVMSLLLFRRFVGIGIGTLIMTACNGLLIGWCGKLLEKTLDIRPRLKRLAEKFAV